MGRWDPDQPWGLRPSSHESNNTLLALREEMRPPPDLEMLGSLPQEAEATFWGVKAMQILLKQKQNQFQFKIVFKL